MTDPKTAARDVAGRLSTKRIAVRHTQALDLVAAGAGLANRHVLSTMKTLPPISRINIDLLTSAASVLARHDLARRATIVDTTSDVLLGRPEQDKGIDLSPLTEALAGLKAQFAPKRDGHVIAWLQDDPGSDDVPTLFWSNEDGWVHFDTADVFPDREGRLPTVGMGANTATIRWMTWEHGRFRSAVDEALLELDGEDPELGHDPEVPGERMIDYDRIASMLYAKGVFDRPVGPLEIAVRDGADRASFYVASLSSNRDTAGGMVHEWIEDVAAEFADGNVPDEDRLRELLMEGDGAISNIRHWLSADERLWAWLNVAGYPDAIDNEIVPADSGVVDGIRLEHDGIDLWITRDELTDPDCFLASAKAKPLIDHLVKDAYFTRWERDNRPLPQDKVDAIARDVIDGIRKAKTTEERRFAGERALVQHLSCNDPEDEWMQTGYDLWSKLDEAVCEAAAEAGLSDAYDESEWNQAAATAFERRIVEDDTSTPAGMLSSFDMAEVMFWLIPPKASPDDLCNIAGPWPDPQRVVIDDAFQFALAKLGWTTSQWRDHVKSTEPSELTGRRPPRGTGQGFPGAIDGSQDPLVSLEDLKVIIENGCTQFFGLVLYAYVPLTDLIDLDLSRHFSFGKAHVALYNPYAGTFMSEAARPGPIIVKDGVDGRLEGLLGSSPKDFCGMVMESFETRITDPELDAKAIAATAALKATLPQIGLSQRFPGHRIDWAFAGDDRMRLTAKVGLDDAGRRYSYRPVAVRIDGSGVATVEFLDG